MTQVRLQIWNAVQTRLLFQASVPVSYQFRPPANIVTSIGLTPASPNILKFDDVVNIALKYTTNDAGGVRIFTRPFSGGVLTPNYGANPSPLYPVGSGTATGYFTISDLPATVDHIRIQMWNARPDNAALREDDPGLVSVQVDGTGGELALSRELAAGRVSLPTRRRIGCERR